MINLFYVLVAVAALIFVMFLVIITLIIPKTENFEDKIKYEHSKIIFNNLKNNKGDFDEYKKKLRDYPELIDVIIYDKVKHLENFTVNDIYNKL